MADYSDAASIKALAHPLRLQLLHALAIRGSATATELSDEVGESPSNCSFHLRKLADAGYIERADDATGRDKPWRVSDPTQNFRPAADDAAAQQAEAATLAQLLEWDVSLIRAATTRQNPPDWRGATFRSSSTLIVTPDEARELQERFLELIAPYVDRLSAPTAPEGAGALRVFASSVYLPEHQRAIDEHRRPALPPVVAESA